MEPFECSYVLLQAAGGVYHLMLHGGSLEANGQLIFGEEVLDKMALCSGFSKDKTPLFLNLVII